MRQYRVTCLTPVLVGDGQKLSPIDYMVWKDQVNVLDQRRIFRLLAKGPRLDGYLTQIKKAQKLDFASWGGFAQNFAGRRIPFAHPEYTEVWNRAPADQLFIPTFAANSGGVYLPATAIKGALRTGLLLARLNETHLREVESRLKGDRPPRYPASAMEGTLLGPAGASRTRPLLVGDSKTAPAPGATKVFLLRAATLRNAGPKTELGWKSPVTFAEMAVPGMSFEGSWEEKFEFHRPALLESLHWKEVSARRRATDAANRSAQGLLALQAEYARQTGLASVAEEVAGLQKTLESLREGGKSCLLCLGWGTGLVAKAAVTQETQDAYRQLLRYTVYDKAIRSGLPFPKTRKVVFEGDRPWTLPGWVRLDLEG